MLTGLYSYSSTVLFITARSFPSFIMKFSSAALALLLWSSLPEDASAQKNPTKRLYKKQVARRAGKKEGGGSKPLKAKETCLVKEKVGKKETCVVEGFKVGTTESLAKIQLPMMIHLSSKIPPHGFSAEQREVDSSFQFPYSPFVKMSTTTYSTLSTSTCWMGMVVTALPLVKLLWFWIFVPATPIQSKKILIKRLPTIMIV